MVGGKLQLVPLRAPADETDQQRVWALSSVFVQIFVDEKYLVRGQAIRPALLSRTSTLEEGGDSLILVICWAILIPVVVIITIVHQTNRDDDETWSTLEEESLHIF